jgi:Uma2 family endonuclease
MTPPQPDSYVRILPQCGGQSGRAGKYAAGAPELAVEICLSTASRDRGPKKELYRTAGVQEYITVLIEEAKVVWHRLEKGTYIDLKADDEGLLRSVVFPGLWLDPEALLEQDGTRLLEVLNQGLRSAAHQEFVRALAVSPDRNR